MLVPGCLFDATGRLRIAASLGPTPAYFSEGFGFAADGRLSVDTNAPAGSLFNRGFRMSALGAVYGVDGSDPQVYCEGVALNANSAFNYDLIGAVAPASACNGLNFTGATGRVAAVNS